MHIGRAARLAILAAAATISLSAQSTIFISRHADRFGTEPDPELTPLGKSQAEALGRMLIDANIRHIYTTELIRTQQTAAPTARAAGVVPVVVSQEKFDELIADIRRTVRPGEATLVVGHRNTVPRIVKALTGKEIPELASGEYGRLVVVTLFPQGESSVVTLRY